jgi:nucleoside-diphosphate-sugar epimerase
MSKILILGGSGFIGSAIVEFFSKNTKLSVTATYCTKNPKSFADVNWKKVDLLDYKQTKKLLQEKFDVIVNAAVVTSGANMISNNPQIHVTNNLRINTNLLEN